MKNTSPPWVYLNAVHLNLTQAQAAFERNFIGYLRQQPNPPHFILLTGSEAYGGEATYIPLDKSNLFSYLRHQWEVYRTLCSIYRKSGRFTLYVRSSGLMFAPVWFARRYNCRLVIREGPGHYNLLFYYPRLKWLYPLIVHYARWIVRSADHVIVVTEQIKKTLVNSYALFPSKITVLPNPAPIKQFPKGDLEAWPASWPLDACVIGYVGSLHQHQGISDILDGLALYYQQVASPRPLFLIIVGDGPDRERLKRIVTDHSMDSFVHFTGRIPQAKLTAYYARMHFCVAPYTKLFNERKGSSALKITEYLSYDKYIVAASIEDYHFLEENELGYCYPLEDPVHLARLFHKLSGASIPRIKGRAYISKHRSPIVIFERYLEAIKPN